MNSKRLLVVFLLVFGLCLSSAFAMDSENLNSSGVIHSYSDSDDVYFPNWSSGGVLGLNSTHSFITQNAINLVKNNVSGYPLSSYTTTLVT